MQAAARVFGMEPGDAVTAPAYDSGTPTVLTPMAGTWGCLVCMPAVRAAGVGQCMMLAAARVFGMGPGGAVTTPAYDSGTPTVLTL